MSPRRKSAEWYFAGLAGSRSDRTLPRHKFDLYSHPLLQSSRCDRNIINSRELSRSCMYMWMCVCVFMCISLSAVSNKFGGVAHNNSIRIFWTLRRSEGYSDTFFRDTGPLSLYLLIIVKSNDFFVRGKQKRINWQELQNSSQALWSRRSNLSSFKILFYSRFIRAGPCP